MELSNGRTEQASFPCVNQEYHPVSIETMPVPKKLKVGETAEIRCQLHRDGRYEETEYFIRYFQPDGAGTLQMSDGTVLLPNERPEAILKIHIYRLLVG